MNKIATLIHTKFRDTTIPQILLLNQETPVLSESVYLHNQALLEKLSNVSVSRSTNALGLIYDYYYLIFKPSKPTLYQEANFLYDMISARLKANVLNWHKLSEKEAPKQIYQILRFCKWLKAHEHYKDDDFTKLLKKSYDFYQTKEPLKYQKTGIQDSSRFLKAFPENKIKELLDNTNNYACKIAFLLMMNGRRSSEILHMFSSDIEFHKGKLKAYLAHPETSYYRWNNKVGTREEYLKEVFDLKPRTKHNQNRRVGFKGLRFADPIRQVSQVHFILNTDKLLLQYHKEYMKERSKIKTHPYYLVNQDGNPIHIDSIRREFYRVCEKIELNHSVQDGTAMISLRYFYGRYCKQLDMNYVEIAQAYSLINPFASLIYEKETVNYKSLELSL